MRISDWSSDVCSSDLPALQRASRPGDAPAQDDAERIDVQADDGLQPRRSLRQVGRQVLQVVGIQRHQRIAEQAALPFQLERDVADPLIISRAADGVERSRPPGILEIAECLRRRLLDIGLRLALDLLDPAPQTWHEQDLLTSEQAWF